MVPYKEKLFADELEKQKLPYVIIDNQTPGGTSYSILSDNKKVAI